MIFTDKKAILFDLDGTLIDSVPDLALAVNYTLDTLKRNTFSEDTIRSWVGNGAQTLVKRALLGQSNIDEDINENLFQEALDIFLTFYGDNLSVATTMYPNVKETLTSLKNRGYTLAIITNKPFKFVEPILKELGIDGLFSLILGGDSLEVKKPDPLPLLHACNELNIKLDQAVMVGDSRNDIVAANEANIESIGVTYGYNYGESITVYNPITTVSNFLEIDNLFENISHG